MVRDFWQSYAPFTLKIIWNFQYQLIISPAVLHIQLKLDKWICHETIQVKFEFGYGSLIFGIVMPLSLWKLYEIFSFCWLSPNSIIITHSNLTYGCVKGMPRPSSNLVMVKWFLQIYKCPFDFKKIIWNFQFLFIISQYSTQIWHMDMSKKCAGQVWIWL
jgi:hypothetical protein